MTLTNAPTGEPEVHGAAPGDSQFSFGEVLLFTHCSVVGMLANVIVTVQGHHTDLVPVDPENGTWFFISNQSRSSIDIAKMNFSDHPSPIAVIFVLGLDLDLRPVLGLSLDQDAEPIGL